MIFAYINKSFILLRSLVPVLVLAFLLPCMSVPALAARSTVDYTTLDPIFTVDSNGQTVTLTLPVDVFRIRGGVNNGSKNTWKVTATGRDTAEFTYPDTDGTTVVWAFDFFQNRHLLLDNIPDGSKFRFTFTTYCDIYGPTTTTPSGSGTAYFYKTDVSNIYTSQSLNVAVAETGVDGQTFEHFYSCEYMLNKKEANDAWFSFVASFPDYTHNDYTYKASIRQVELEMSISALQAMQEEQKKTNALLEKVNEQLAEQGQKQDQIIENQEQLLQQPEQEKAEANQTGNSSVDGIVSGIPDKGKEFQMAIKQFAASASYEGTEAKLPIPAVKMPEIPGLVPGVTLWEPEQLDFEEYITLIPFPLLTLARALLTGGLIVYCFKELYDTIQYVLVLQGGGGL